MCSSHNLSSHGRARWRASERSQYLGGGIIDGRVFFWLYCLTLFFLIHWFGQSTCKKYYRSVSSCCPHSSPRPTATQGIRFLNWNYFAPGKLWRHPNNCHFEGKGNIATLLKRFRITSPLSGGACSRVPTPPLVQQHQKSNTRTTTPWIAYGHLGFMGHRQTGHKQNRTSFSPSRVPPCLVGKLQECQCTKWKKEERK